MVADFSKLATNLGQALQQKSWKLATAESCTGGWLAQEITAIAGSSGWFDRGFVTYSNQAKQEMLRVKSSTLEKFGAVSEETARDMADGALQQSVAHISLSITGIAGPDGGTANKPVGTVWFGLAIKGSETYAWLQNFAGDRQQIRAQAVEFALQRMNLFLYD